MSSKGEPVDRDDATARRLADLAPFVMFIVDATGTITWTSGAVDRLFGIDREQVHGTNILDHIDAEWSPESLDSVGYAMTASGPQRPMLFRLNRFDGTQVIIEVTANSQLDDPLVQGLAVYARPWHERWLLDQVLDAIAGNAPLDETLDLLVAVMGAEILDGDGAVHFRDPVTGRPRTRSRPELDARLSGRDPYPDAPWDVAMRTGVETAVPVADLDPALAELAAAHGYAWCWAWPVAVPRPDTTELDDPTGCLVLWRRLDEPPDHTCRSSLARLVRLTGLLFEREEAAAALRYAALHDALTGLANRADFFARLQTSLDDPAGGPLVGVVYLDLDGFKPINDTFGHGAGDALLRQVAGRLQSAVRADDLVARMGGDEFTVLCPQLSSESDLEHLAERILETLRSPMILGDVEVTVGASVGIAAAPPGSCSIDALVDAADLALYTVKDSSKGGWRRGSPLSDP